MKTWPVQKAKTHFSEFLKASLTEGPQVETLLGVETAVLLDTNADFGTGAAQAS